MKSDEIYVKLTSVFRDVLEDDRILVGSELAANDLSGWDSLTNIRLVLTVEKAFGVKFSAAEIGQLRNVGDLVGLVQSKTSRAAD